MTYLVLPAYARSSSLRMLADACGATMTAPGAGTGTESGSSGSGSAGTGTGPEAGAGAAGNQGGTGTTEPQDVGSLPAWAQTLIHNTRSEAAGHRQAKSAAEQRVNDQLEAAKVALGLAEAPTSEQLGERLAAAQRATRQAQIEVAIVRNAAAHGADPSALTDSRTFMDSVSALDPSASDFSTKVSDAIKAGVETNDKLKAAPSTGGQAGEQQTGGARRPAPDASQGSGGRGERAQRSAQSGRDLYRQRRPQATATGS